MPNNLAHFAINADDTARARGFYQNVFGWQFQAWGPPDFFQISTGDKTSPPVQGALQKRREIVPGARMIGYECSFSVADVDAVAAAVGQRRDRRDAQSRHPGGRQAYLL